MKFCNNCGEKVTAEESVFCSNCGTKVNLSASVVSPNQLNKDESFKSGKEYVQLQYEKISFNKSKLKIIKTFIQENLILIFFLNFIAYLLLTIASATVGWIYIAGLLLWGYLYPLLTNNKQTSLNKTIEHNLVNSDVMLKNYLAKQKTAQNEREMEIAKDHQREKERQLKVEFEMQAEKEAKQQERFANENAKQETTYTASPATNTSVSGGDVGYKYKKKSHINTIILFVGMLPILIVVSFLISSNYLFVNITGSLLLPSLIVSFFSSMLYYIPTFVSRGTGKTMIFIINLFFGWSIIGWILCLVWAMNDNSKWDIMQIMQQNSKANG